MLNFCVNIITYLFMQVNHTYKVERYGLLQHAIIIPCPDHYHCPEQLHKHVHQYIWVSIY